VDSVRGATSGPLEEVVEVVEAQEGDVGGLYFAATFFSMTRRRMRKSRARKATPSPKTPPYPVLA